MREEPYERLQFYKNLVILRKFIYDISRRFERSHSRLVGQMRDAARSAKQNIMEGYKKDSALSFGNFIKISGASLEELKGDLKDCSEDKLISEEEFQFSYDLATKTGYMMSKYLDALYEMEKQGKWKKRWPNNH